MMLFLATGLLLCAVLTSIMPTNNNAAYAQQQIPIPKSHSIRITYPTPGQQVPVSGNFTIKGVVHFGLATPLKGATDGNTSGCHVIVQINENPYRPATGTGPNGQRDFSTWSYVVDAKSTPIKQGPDKIAARLSCPKSPNLTTHVTMNVTGAGGSNSTSS